jgi:F-box protein 28
MPHRLLSYKEAGCHGNECVSASSTAKTYLCLESPPRTSSSTSKGDESPNHANANGIEEQAPEPLPQSNMVLRKRIRKIKQGMKRYVTVLIF